MAAKKSNRRQLSTHADEHKSLAPQRRTSHSRQGGAGKTLEPCARELTGRKQTDRGRPNRSEVIRLLAEALALVRTIGMAMQEFADHPMFGNVCVAFQQASEVLAKAHSEVGRLLERRA